MCTRLCSMFVLAPMLASVVAVRARARVREYLRVVVFAQVAATMTEVSSLVHQCYKQVPLMEMQVCLLYSSYSFGIWAFAGVFLIVPSIHRSTNCTNELIDCVFV